MNAYDHESRRSRVQAPSDAVPLIFGLHFRIALYLCLVTYLIILLNLFFFKIFLCLVRSERGLKWFIIRIKIIDNLLTFPLPNITSSSIDHSPHFSTLSLSTPLTSFTYALSIPLTFQSSDISLRLLSAYNPLPLHSPNFEFHSLSIHLHHITHTPHNHPPQHFPHFAFPSPHIPLIRILFTSRFPHLTIPHILLTSISIISHYHHLAFSNTLTPPPPLFPFHSLTFPPLPTFLTSHTWNPSVLTSNFLLTSYPLTYHSSIPHFPFSSPYSQRPLLAIP